MLSTSGAFVGFQPLGADAAQLERALLFVQPVFSHSASAPVLSPFSQASWDGSDAARLQLVLASGACYAGTLQRDVLRPSATLWSVVEALCGSGFLAGAPGGGGGAAAPGHLRVTHASTMLAFRDNLNLCIVRDAPSGELLSAPSKVLTLAPIDARTEAVHLAQRLWRCQEVLAASNSGQSSKEQQLQELRSRAEAAEAALARAEEARLAREHEVLQACALVLSAKRAGVALLQQDLDAERQRLRGMQLQLDSKDAEIHQHVGKVIRLQEEISARAAAAAAAAAAGGGGGKAGAGQGRRGPAAPSAGGAGAPASPFAVHPLLQGGAAAAAAAAAAAGGARGQLLGMAEEQGGEEEDLDAPLGVGDTVGFGEEEGKAGGRVEEELELDEEEGPWAGGAAVGGGVAEEEEGEQQQGGGMDSTEEEEEEAAQAYRAGKAQVSDEEDELLTGVKSGGGGGGAPGGGAGAAAASSAPSAPAAAQADSQADGIW